MGSPVQRPRRAAATATQRNTHADGCPKCVLLGRLCEQHELADLRRRVLDLEAKFSRLAKPQLRRGGWAVSSSSKGGAR